MASHTSLLINKQFLINQSRSVLFNNRYSRLRLCDCEIIFLLGRQQTRNSVLFQRITTQDPMDENNPFFRAGGGPMKPVAKLVIKKLREYKKSCSELDNDDEESGYLDFALPHHAGQ